jgi:hypothetical protein
LRSEPLTPFFLGAILGGIASGRVPKGNAAGDIWTSWANPSGAMVGCARHRSDDEVLQPGALPIVLLSAVLGVADRAAVLA